MSERVFEEGNLVFDFTNCGEARKFDVQNNSGLCAVDFIVDKPSRLLYIEVKDYQNPGATAERRQEDLEMLRGACSAKGSVFALKMGSKIKDSLLCEYAKGEAFQKPILYLLCINLDELKAAERLKLFERIRGFVPTGLNNDRFTAFKRIEFKLVNTEQLQKHGVCCTSKALGEPTTNA